MEFLLFRAIFCLLSPAGMYLFLQGVLTLRVTSLLPKCDVSSLPSSLNAGVGRLRSLTQVQLLLAFIFMCHMELQDHRLLLLVAAWGF